MDPPPTDTPLAEVAGAIDHVASKAAEWAGLPATAKKALMEECLELLKLHTDDLAEAAIASRGYDSSLDLHDHLNADATMISGVLTASWLRGGISLMESLVSTGQPPKGSRTTLRPDGSHRVRVYPGSFKDALVGDTGRWKAVPIGEGADFEVVIRGKEGEAPTQFNPLELPPSVTGVLGAGNTEILNDIIHALCLSNSVVIYKSNPVLSKSNRVKQRILAPLIDKGYLAFVYGGLEQGRAIVDSPKVTRITLTGSGKTYDHIVWGDRDKRDLCSEPVVTKPVLAELGSVNPYIVVPGDAPWSASDIDAQAEALVAYKLVNNCHVCAAPQVVVTCRQWAQRSEFIAAVRKKFADAPTTCCFYPGIATQYRRHLEAMGTEAIVSAPSDGLELGDCHMPLAFQQDVHVPTESSQVPLAFAEEAFCPILYEVALDTTPNLTLFLPAAVEFCHKWCWGNLTCMIVVDDSTRKCNEKSFQTQLDSMRFGTIGVNFPASGANAFPALTWGGFPGNDPRDVQSGSGQIGNFYCFENVEKSIMVNRFSNLHTFKLASSRRAKRQARTRARRISAVFAHMTFWRLVKFASAHFVGI